MGLLRDGRQEPLSWPSTRHEPSAQLFLLELQRFRWLPLRARGRNACLERSAASLARRHRARTHRPRSQGAGIPKHGADAAELQHAQSWLCSGLTGPIHICGFVDWHITALSPDIWTRRRVSGRRRRRNAAARRGRHRRRDAGPSARGRNSPPAALAWPRAGNRRPNGGRESRCRTESNATTCCMVLPPRFHGQSLGNSATRKKPLKADCSQGLVLVAGIGFEPMTFRL